MDVKEIKEEIKEEETFLLKLFQLEKFVKKYKIQLIVLVVLIITGVIGYQVNSYLKTQELIKTNTAYNTLLKNPNDKKALQILKENKKLFNLYLLHTSNDDIKKLSQVAKEGGIVGNIAKYQIAMLKGDKKDIQNYTMTIDSIYKDLALLNLERLYLKDNNHKKAEEVVKQIQDADIAKLAQGLLHYGIVK
jgi:predicted negative regulator of RcsB-dependent stress response